MRRRTVALLLAAAWLALVLSISLDVMGFLMFRDVSRDAYGALYYNPNSDPRWMQSAEFTFGSLLSLAAALVLGFLAVASVARPEARRSARKRWLTTEILVLGVGLALLAAGGLLTGRAVGLWPQDQFSRVYCCWDFPPYVEAALPALEIRALAFVVILSAATIAIVREGFSSSERSARTA